MHRCRLTLSEYVTVISNRGTKEDPLAGRFGRDSDRDRGGPTSQAHRKLGQPRPTCPGIGDPGHPCVREDPARVRAARDSRFSGNQRDSQEALSRQEIRRVSVKRQGHRGRNTLIGLAVGAGGGLAFGAVAVSRTSPGAMFRNLGYAVFPPLGAIVGTVIGVALPTGAWRDVYRAP